jgi:hypothetical protein
MRSFPLLRHVAALPRTQAPLHRTSFGLQIGKKKESLLGSFTAPLTIDKSKIITNCQSMNKEAFGNFKLLQDGLISLHLYL